MDLRKHEFRPSEGRGCWFDPSQARHASVSPSRAGSAREGIASDGLVRPTTVLVALCAAAWLAGCASTPSGTTGATTGSVVPPAVATRPSGERDGADPRPPANLAAVPDAEPRVEPIRAGGPNKPYEVLGRDYVPLTEDRPFEERGLASWYGRKFHGRRTSSGETYNMYEMTAAHPTLPIPSYALVRNPANGREVVVRINDRGPFHPGRIVDLSYTAALKLDLLRGVAPVELRRITHDEIRSDAWRKTAPTDTLLALTSPAGVVAAPRVAAAAVATPVPAPSPFDEPAVLPEIRTATLAIEPAAPTSARAAAAEPPRRAYTPSAQGYWVQLGAFREHSGAEAFQRRVASELEWLAPLMAIYNEAAVHRLQAGPYPSREEAGQASQRIRQALQLVPVVVERR